MERSSLNEAIAILRDQLSLLDSHIETLKQRREQLFSLTVHYVKNRKYREANRIANEAALVDKALKLFTNLRIALEAVVVRLETIKEVGELRGLLTPVIKVLDAMSSKTAKVIPDFSDSIAEAQQILLDILSQPLRLEAGVEAMDEEGEGVGEEARTLAEELRKEKEATGSRRSRAREKE